MKKMYILVEYSALFRKENQPMRLKIVKQAYLEFILVALEPRCCSLYHVATLYFDDGSCFVLFTLLGLLFHWM